MSDDRPMDRRRFFREGLRELLKPLADAAEPIERALREFESIQSPAEPRVSRPRPTASAPAPPPVVWLRPPGALPESDFLETCSRCGTCVSVCPAQAIKIDPTAARGHGAPYIVASEMPCVICEGLHCMKQCPSGALKFTPVAQIDMGTAVWHEHLCVRSRGEECRICVDQCPIGEVAIVLEAGRVKVIEEGCTGCGVCEHQCPTSPKSITITPRL
jgi:ferredoxin-type protein NapG